MIDSRNNFYEAIAAFSYALDSTDIVSKDPIVDRLHNERARLLRNGLAIIGFSIVEEFVKARTGEILEKIGKGLTPFNELPEGLRKAAIIGVTSAIIFQSKFIEQIDILKFYQTHSKIVATSLDSTYAISPLALSNNYTNLSIDDVEHTFKAFRIDKPWPTIHFVVNKLGLGVLDIKQSFKNATERRHMAAHQARANTEYSALKSYANEARSLCLAYDLILSQALNFIVSKDEAYLKNKLLATNQINMRFLKPQGKIWREVSDTNTKTRAFKTGNDIAAMKIDCLQRGRKAGFAVIELDVKGIPVSWHTPSIDF